MEILAPAGSIAALKAAIKGGANAVYLGLGEHNARIKSNDFTTENLAEWVDYTHLFGVKVHLTLNTAVKDEEMDRVLSLASLAGKCGVDALIVADLGLVRVLSEISDIPIHLSTQAGVQNYKDLAALKGLRIRRVILAREALLSDISAIKKYVDEVEIFAQGAICVSFSGGCLLGSKMYGASGNRGLCNQACRLTYTAYDESGRRLKEGKLLSPHDLSLGDKVRSLPALGVDSIKIEGRLKRPQYVYAATRYYRDLLNGSDASESLESLKLAFNRGFVSGYSLKKSDPVIGEKISGHIGVKVGEVVRVIDKGGYKYASVRSDHPFVKGDGAKILRRGAEVGGSDVTSVVKEGEKLYLIPVSEGVKVGDEVRLTTDAERDRYSEKIVNKLPIRVSIFGEVGKPIRVAFEACGVKVERVGTSIAEAGSGENNDPIFTKLSKLGETDFVLEEKCDLVTSPIYVNASELNAIRRDLVAKLRTEIIRRNTPHYVMRRVETSLPSLSPTKKRAVILEVADARDLTIPTDAFVLNPYRFTVDEVGRFLSGAEGKPCYLKLPKIVREAELPFWEKLLTGYPSVGIWADNLYAVALARELGRPYILGFGMNLWNGDESALFSDATYRSGSTEHPDAGDLLFRAGKTPLMSFAHCPVSVCTGVRCGECDRRMKYLFYEGDRRRYRIRRQEGASCLFTMYEDEITRYPAVGVGKSFYYSLIGLNQEEKDVIMKYMSEDRGE